MVEGARRLSGLRHDVRADDDPDFLMFVGIDSESDGFPIGESRSLWDAAALSVADQQREAFEARFREAALEAAARLIAKYRAEAD